MTDQVHSTKKRQNASRYEKLAISLRRELAQAVRDEARAVGAPSLSAFIAQTIEEMLERDRLQEVLDEVFREHPMTEEERKWADDVLAD